MRYKDLKELVLYHDHLYYDESNPEISDKEYDAFYDQLVQLEREQGFKDWDSPTLRVGHERGKTKHPYKLYSLKKIYKGEEEEPIPSAFEIQSIKLDGACVAHIFDRGSYIRTITRGDGEFGEDISHLFKDELSKVKLPTGSLISIVCECITFQQVENYRNYVAGALNLKDLEEFKSRNITFVVHDVLGVPLNYSTRLNLVSQQFMTVLNHKHLLTEIPSDGLVFRVDSYQLEQQLGHTSKYPKFAVALKERAKQTAITTITDVTWAIGRTGTVNPKAIVNPVILGGATVSRLTLHNIEFIELNDICVGDKIEIERAGDIIPKFIRIVEKSPVRQEITIQNAEESVEKKLRRLGPKLYVADKSVDDEKVILNYASHLNIQGLGPASIRKLGLTSISDLYKNQTWDALGANGIKIAQEIENSKTKSYKQVLAGLGIPGVGASVAEKIVKVLPKFSQLHQIEFEKVEKIGPKMTEKILAWLDENYSWVSRLPVKLEQEPDTIETTTSKVICITGKLDRSRKLLADTLTNLGYTVRESVTKNTYALITDGKIASEKTKTAEKYGIKIINYYDNKELVLTGKF